MAAAFAFGRHDFHIIDKKALFWPARAALIVADLHFEKGSWFAAHGQMLPPYDSHATLDGLDTLLDQTGAREIWCLGDNVHDAGGWDRLEPALAQRLAALTHRIDWHWIIGNHDEAGRDAPATAIGGTIHDEALVDGLILRHEALVGEMRPELSGHYHPKVRLTARGKSVTRPCFVRSETKLILPAFGAYAGGLDVRDPAIKSCVGQGAEAVLESAGQLVVVGI
jgi:uncharacterized protein